jgi:hypothetical protein
MIDIAEQLQNLLELKAMLRDAVAKESSPAALARYDDLLREVQDRIDGIRGIGRDGRSRFARRHDILDSLSCYV